MPRIANRDARRYVQNLEPFQGSNLFAELRGKDDKINAYIVYSYGYHWPLFIFDNQQQIWYENSDKVSQTTTIHRTRTHPYCDTIPLTRDKMEQKLADLLAS